MASLYLLLAFAFVPVRAIYQVVMDKTTLIKHQQFVSGMSLFSFWIDNYEGETFFNNYIPKPSLI